MQKFETPDTSAASLEKHVAELERRIDELKSKYILFFAGDLKLPPEKEREDLEKAVRNMIYGGTKTTKISMIIQNMASRFSLYNNMWLKKLNEAETGVSAVQKKKGAAAPLQPKMEKSLQPKHQEIQLNLNDENSFERLIEVCLPLLPQSDKRAIDKERIINTMKTRMLTSNLVVADIRVTLQNGKLNIAIKAEP